MLKSIAVAVFATAFSSVAATAQDFDLQGHRGARGLAPENTLAAFAHALTIGVTTLELDVGVNRDGVVVISHNPRLNPVITRRDGAWLSADGPAIFSLNAAELRAYDVGRINPASRYAARFSDQTPADGARIPTLADVVRLIARSGNAAVRLNIETKLAPSQMALTLGPQEFAAAVLEAVDKLGMAGRVTIQSFDWRTLHEVQRRAPEIPTAYLSARQRCLDNISRRKFGPSRWTAGFDIDDSAAAFRAWSRRPAGASGRLITVKWTLAGSRRRMDWALPSRSGRSTRKPA